MRGGGTRLAFALAAFITALLLTAPAAALADAAPLDRATAAVFPIVAQDQRIGSGVLVAPDLVLTAAHVVRAAQPEYVLDGGRLLETRVVAVDDARDLALLSVSFPPGVTPIEWGDSAGLSRGQEVVVLGYPLGMSSVALTKGVVSSPSQSYAGSTYIQTDAAINPGNSGGALVDAQGRLVGINVAKIAGSDVGGIGFAVPEADAYAFVTRYASVPSSPSAGAPGWLWAAAAFAGLSVMFAATAVVVRRRRAAPAGDTDAELPVEDPPADPHAGERRRFRVDGSASAVTLELRLPAVAGSAHNADIHVQDRGVGEYQVRFMPGPGRGATALSLVGDGGMYCGDACVLEAVLQPGDSVRVGQTVVTLLERSE